MPLDETYAWNWQQGCMLHWLPGAAENTVIYNKREDGRLVSVVRNVENGETRTLPLPIYDVTQDGTQTVTANFRRIHHTRPGYGYAGVPDAGEAVLQPADDGIFWMDVATGESRLIISIEQMANFQPRDDFRSGKHWFNHLLVNPNSTRFAFLHRWQQPGGKWFTRLVTANLDGSDIHLMADDNHVSHYDWFSPSQLLAWSTHQKLGMHYHLYTDRSTEIAILGEDVFSVDGHCSFSPDREWMMTDTYPDADQNRTLMLYHLESGTRIDIGKFYAPPELSGPIRCDLHPRWRQDGKAVCIDSAHEGMRQVYVLDVASIVDSYR
jgi:hypothetical protein